LTIVKKSVNKINFDLLNGGIYHTDGVLIPPPFMCKSCTKNRDLALIQKPDRKAANMEELTIWVNLQ